MIHKTSKHLHFLLLIAFLLSGFTLFSQVPEEFCVSQDEYALYRKINDYRQSKGQQVVPISKSLCYVAKMHVVDLFENHPDTSFCNLNSWSDKGPWTACCHSKQKPDPECILNKPKELTDYDGTAHEICYFDSHDVEVDTVFNFWFRVEQAKDILVNNRKWSMYVWQAMGVAIYKNYACVWLGEAKDTLTEPGICKGKMDMKKMSMAGKKEASRIVSEPTNRFYLIFGSFSTLDDAMKAINQYKEEGFYQSKVLEKDDTFRVSLSDHSSMQEARDAKSRLGNDYKEAWIVKY